MQLKYLLLIANFLFFSSFALADSIEKVQTSISDDQASMIKEALSLARINERFVHIQKTYPKAQFYEQIVSAFKEDFDTDKLKKIIEWQHSPLGQKYNSLKHSYGELLNPLDIAALALLSEKRMDLLKQIKDLQGNVALETMKVVFKQSFDSINELLPPDKQIDFKLKEEAVESRTKKWMESMNASQLNSLVSIYESFSDEELEQLVGYLKSDQLQWFNNCWLKGYLRALVPAIKEWAIHNNLEAEVSKELKDELILPESQYWYVTYYYRTKEVNRVVPMLKAVLADQNLISQSSRMLQFVHFFSTVLHDQDKLKKEVEQLKASYSSSQQEFISAIIKEANEFKTASLDSKEGLDLAWAEYYAIGDENIIKQIFSLIGKFQGESNQEFLRKVQVSIIKSSLKDNNVYHNIQNLSKNTDGVNQGEIDRMLSIIDSFSDFAWDFNIRGNNYMTQNKNNEALEEFKSALTYEPDYAIALSNMAHIFFDYKKDYEKVLLYAQASLYLNPEYEGAFNDLGRYYFNQGSYGKAVEYFLNALKSYPKWPTYIHNVGLSYQRLGDTANTIKYYNSYLEIAPQGEFSDEIRSYLASVKAPPNENVSDPFMMLKEKQYDSLERYLSDLLIKKQKDENGYSLLFDAYSKLVWPKGSEAISSQTLHLFEEWVSQNPSSHFANASLGWFYIDYAWQVRGDFGAKTVTEDGWKYFKERLLKAKELLEKAYEENPDDPLPPAELIRVANGLDLDKTYVEKQFQRAIKADPAEYEIYERKLSYLKPQWHGSDEEMLSFARESIQNAPAHSLIPKVLIEAHLEIYWNLRRDKKNEKYFKRSGVWEELRDTFESLLKEFPNSNKLHNQFCFIANLSEDYKIAKEQLALLNDNWDEEIWRSFNYFQSVKTWLLSK